MRGRRISVAIALLGALWTSVGIAGPREGRVIEISADAVYLDGGGDDGLAIGSQITIFRDMGDPSPLTLTVQQIADHFAMAGPAPAAGTIAVGARWMRAGGIDGDLEPLAVTPPPAEPLPDPELLVARWKEALAAPPPLLAFKGEPRAPTRARRGTRIQASVLSYPSNGSAAGSYQGGRLDLRSTGGLPWRTGLAYRIDLDLTGWAQRTDRSRLRPSTDPFLLLHACALEIAPSARAFRAAAGRFRAAPSFAGPLIDGFAASLRRDAGGDATDPSSPRAGAREVGIYGGLLPDPVDLQPDSKRTAIGAFAWTTTAISDRLAGRLGASVETRRFRGAALETGRLRVNLDRAPGTGIEVGAAAWHASSSLRFGDAHVSIRGTRGSQSHWLLYRESESAFDRKQREAFLDEFGAEADPARRARRAEAGFSWARSARTRLDAVAVYAGGDAGLNRWMVEPTLDVRRGIWALRSWRVGYRGSFGWQEGHEADIGGNFILGAWKLDLRLGGGVIHQSKAFRTSPIGRGLLGLRRPVGDSGTISLAASAHGTPDFVGGAAQLAFSMRF